MDRASARDHLVVSVLAVLVLLLTVTGAAPGGRRAEDNLALRRPYTLSALPSANWYPLLRSRGQSWPEPATVLTDGQEVLLGSFWTSGRALNFVDVGYVEIQIDLGRVQPIAEIATRHLARPEAGIRFHARNEFWVSEDGESFRKVAEYINPEPPDPRSKADLSSGYRIFGTGALRTRGRYVLVRAFTHSPGRHRFSRYVGFDEVVVRRGHFSVADVEPEPDEWQRRPRAVMDPAVADSKGLPAERDWLPEIRSAPLQIGLTPQYWLGDDAYHLSVGGTYVLSFQPRAWAEGPFEDVRLDLTLPPEVVLHDARGGLSALEREPLADGKERVTATLSELGTDDGPYFVVSTPATVPVDSLATGHYRVRYRFRGQDRTSGPHPIRFVLDPPVEAPAPFARLSGFWIPYAARDLGDVRGTLARLGRFYAKAGFNAANGGHGSQQVAEAMRDAGLSNYTGANLAPNALMFARFTPDLRDRVPRAHRFRHHPRSRHKALGICPTRFISAEYDGLRLEAAKRILAETDHVYENWEPYMFHGSGCICSACRAAFTRFTGWSATHVAAEWPDIVIDPKSREHNAFMTHQLGEVVRTLDDTVARAGREMGRAERPHYVPSISPKYFVPGSHDQAIHDPRAFLPHLKELMVWRYDNAIAGQGVDSALLRGNNLSMLVPLAETVRLVRSTAGGGPRVYYLGTESYEGRLVLPRDQYFMAVLAFVEGYDGHGTWTEGFKQDARYLREQARANELVHFYEAMLRGASQAEDVNVRPVAPAAGPTPMALHTRVFETASGHRLVALGNDGVAPIQVRVRAPGRDGRYRLRDPLAGESLGSALTPAQLTAGVSVAVAPKRWRLVTLEREAGSGGS